VVLIPVTHELLQLIAEIDEFKGKWEALKNMSPERLRRLRKAATIESVGSSTRIEGAKLSDAQVEMLLSNLSKTSFKSRDEQEALHSCSGGADGLARFIESGFFFGYPDGWISLTTPSWVKRVSRSATSQCSAILPS
jgi:hypothetical protein